jgi:CRP-like cAMP-binding protein
VNEQELTMLAAPARVSDHPVTRVPKVVPIRPVQPAPVRATRCSACSLRTICMPPELTVDDLAKLDSIICSTRSVKRGETLYRSGDAFQSIYAVRAGSLKTVVMHRDVTREEIGCYLGMKLETVSRMFSKFQRERLVHAHGKTIRIVDAEALARV